MQWKHFTNGKQIPVCRSLIVYKWRGRRGNVTLFCNTCCDGCVCSTLWSQVPVRSQFVDRNGIQPRVRQQAVTFVSTVARRTGMIVREGAGRRDTCAALKAQRTHKSDRKMLQNSRTATRSIKVNALVSYIQVLILRTCDHLSFHIGTPRYHKSLPWALHLPRAAHAAAKLPTLF